MVKKLVVAACLMAALMLAHCGHEKIGPIKDIGVYINELNPNGDDWLELYNSTSNEVNLSGFKVYDDATAKYTIASGTIPPHGYFILHCDGTGVGGNASFKLSGSGETIYLENNKGSLIDKIAFPAIDNGSAYARFPDGGDDWQVTGVPTLGTTNGSAEAATISDVSRSPIVPTKDQDVIVSATIADVQGISTVKLFSQKNQGGFTSVAMTLTAGVYNGTITKANALGQVDYYIEVVNSRNVTTRFPENAPTDTKHYILNEDDVLSLDLVINEFMASNTSFISDPDGAANEYNDWIEIYNAGSSAIDINGFYLSDDNGNPFKFKIEGSTIIPADGYLLVWADEQGGQGKLHANFQLAAAGEEVGLYYFDGRRIDYKPFGAQTENKSYGRSPNGGTPWITFNTPTPGAQNP